jgi:hypothetical protein
MLMTRVRDAMCVLRTGYRADAGPLSAGAVLLGHVLEHAIEDGCRRLEWPGASESLASSVATDAGPAVTVCLYPKGRVRCRFCHVVDARIKPAVRWAVPKLASVQTPAREN